MCVSLCATVIHSTAQNSSDNIPSYRPDNHHSSDNVYWRAGVHAPKVAEVKVKQKYVKPRNKH